MRVGIKSVSVHWWFFPIQFNSVAQLCPTLCDPRDCSMPGCSPCPSPTPGACSNSCTSSWWCCPTISSSLVLFSSCLQSFPASGSFQMSLLFASRGQSIRVSALASVLPMNIQDWFPLGWTGWISLQSRDSRQIPIHPYVVLREPPSWWFISFHGWDSIVSSSSEGVVFASGSSCTPDCGYILAALLCISSLQTKAQLF